MRVNYAGSEKECDKCRDGQRLNCIFECLKKGDHYHECPECGRRREILYEDELVV